LSYLATAVLISGATFLVAKIIKCGLGGRWFLSNISNESFIRIPGNSLKPIPLRAYVHEDDIE